VHRRAEAISLMYRPDSGTVRAVGEH
jgi:hypothetical protein